MSEPPTKQIKLRDLRKKEKYQVDDAYLNGYAKLCGVYATAAYNSLCRHADKDQYSFPGIDLMAKQHGCSRPPLLKGIKALERWNVIVVHRGKDERGRQQNNGYTLLDKSEWKPKPSKPRLPGAESTTFTRSRVNDVYCKDTHRASKDTPISPKGDDSLFLKFWEEYPKKVSKVIAARSFRRLNPGEKLLSTILEDVRGRREGEDWQKEGGKFIPYPATYLNHRRWEDQTSEKPQFFRV